LRDELKLQVLENKVLRKIFRPKQDKRSEQFRISHNKDLPDLYRSPSVVGIVKYRRLRWAEHVARIDKK
jgi:hypothetical protein